MLRQRVITALVIGPLALAGLFMLPAPGFTLVLGVLLLIGSWEFIPLAGVSRSPLGWTLVPAQAALMLAMWYSEFHNLVPLHSTLVAFCGLWGLLCVRLINWRPGIPVDFFYRLVGIGTALIVITVGWYSLVQIRLQADGPWWILMLLLIIWAADTGAYFSGKTFGKRRLAPHLSPGKTWEGLIGGLATALVVAQLAALLFPDVTRPSLGLAIVTVVTALSSVGGDLLISMHKRSTGVKDTGFIFPGHGGVLDRLDSLLAGACFFLLAKLACGL